MSPARLPPAGHWLVSGSEAAPLPPRAVHAGPLQLWFDPLSGFVRRVCLGPHEILRGIYAAVRDRNWGTVPPHLSHVQACVAADSFTVTFNADCHQGDIHFVWRGSIQGEASGVLRYDFDGEAKSMFARNRIGFCVLHPIRECAGVAARQTRVDGSVVEGRFPQTIEPQVVGKSSLRELRAVAHEIAPGLWAEVEFDGDVFEMEDQRNWTDASFKTYCTPLALPFPVEIRAGTRIRQRVTLRLIGTAPEAARPRVESAEPQSDVVTVVLSEAPGAPAPRLGLGMASHGAPLTAVEVARLRALRLAHLRVDVRLAAPDWPAVWERAAQEAERLGVGLELALHLPRDAEERLPELRPLVRRESVAVTRVLALREGEPATTPGTLRSVRQALAGLEAPVGAGSDANFCELNREQALGRSAVAEADFVFWSINPQVHAFDHLSLVESLEAQPDTVQTARQFADGKPVAVTPLTLRPRFNAVATGAPAATPAGELPSSVDPRQLSLFAASWTLGSLAALAQAAAESITLYETTGWRGVMERERGSPLPDRFPALPGAVFPVYHVCADLAGAERLAPARVSAPSRVAALTIWSGTGRRSVLLGNLTMQPQRILLHTAVPAVATRLLTPENVVAALTAPERFRATGDESVRSVAGIVELELPPCALARLDESPR